MTLEGTIDTPYETRYGNTNTTVEPPTPLSNLFHSAADTCPFCNQKAGILSREHPECRRAHQAGWDEMVKPDAILPRSNN